MRGAGALPVVDLRHTAKNFLGQTRYDLLVSALVVERVPKADEAVRGDAAEAVLTLDDNDFRAETRRADRGENAGRRSADHADVRLVNDGDPSFGLDYVGTCNFLSHFFLRKKVSPARRENF